jgi:hypothetical protein
MEVNLGAIRTDCTCERIRCSLHKCKEHITAPNLPQPAPDTHLGDLQKQGQERKKLYRPYGVKFLCSSTSFVDGV